MHSLMVEGGRRLSGTVRISGSKNAVLPMLAAAVLFREPCRIYDCPDLTDVDAAVAILDHLGAKTCRHDGCITVDPRTICRWEIPDILMGQMRGSVLFAGALMARFGRCRLTRPGGCALGERPVDYHIAGLRALGADPDPTDPSVFSGELTGTRITLPYPSVGATENLILAALGAGGTTWVCNAAREPEIQCLCRFLRSGGCRIRGDGTSQIRIQGGCPMGAEMAVIPDRMEAATFVCAAAAAGGEILLEHVCGAHLQPVLDTMKQAGCEITETPDGLRIRAGALTAPKPIVTGPYPGFPTDAQAPVMAALLRAEGTTSIRETVFASRMGHIRDLRAMGARIEERDGAAWICGVPALRGAEVQAKDLRGGAALVIAALGAQGKTTIRGLAHIQRGYEDFAGKLCGLGARIHPA